MQHPPIDPVSVVISLLGVFVGAELANVAGPYAVIVASSMTGAAWALSTRPRSSRLSMLAFILRLTFTAALVTVSIEEAIHRWFLPEEMSMARHWLLAPIAILVGAAGDRWPAIFTFTLERIGRLLERRTGVQEPRQ